MRKAPCRRLTGSAKELTPWRFAFYARFRKKLRAVVLRRCLLQARAETRRPTPRSRLDSASYGKVSESLASPSRQGYDVVVSARREPNHYGSGCMGGENHGSFWRHRLNRSPTFRRFSARPRLPRYLTRGIEVKVVGDVMLALWAYQKVNLRPGCHGSQPFLSPQQWSARSRSKASTYGP